MGDPGRSPFGASQAPTIDGVYNVRDIGGFPTAGGATVSPGRVLRAAALDEISDTGLDQLRAFGLRTVLDLRSGAELEHNGRFPVDRFPVRWEHLPSGIGPPTGPDDRSRHLLDHPDPMAPMYRQIMLTAGAEFARGIRILADPANHPTVVHCTSGKDRTGMFVLVLHLTLGVSLHNAIAHYHQDQATTDRAVDDMLRRFPQMGELPPEKMRRMAGTNTRWVTGALAAIGGEHAVPAWLASHGCDSHAQARLRAALTTV